MNVSIRVEQPSDIDAIYDVTKAAFLNEVHSSHTEQFIVSALRRTGKLTVSLVALKEEELVGHLAISPVEVTSGDGGWSGLGPVSVRPDCQGQGIGSLLMRAMITRLQELGSAGCAVLGNPEFYCRFGFQHCPGLVLPGMPPEYFMALSSTGWIPRAEVEYHDSFQATE